MFFCFQTEPGFQFFRPWLFGALSKAIGVSFVQPRSMENPLKIYRAQVYSLKKN